MNASTASTQFAQWRLTVDLVRLDPFELLDIDAGASTAAIRRRADRLAAGARLRADQTDSERIRQAALTLRDPVSRLKAELVSSKAAVHERHRDAIAGLREWVGADHAEAPKSAGPTLTAWFAWLASGSAAPWLRERAQTLGVPGVADITESQWCDLAAEAVLGLVTELLAQAEPGPDLIRAVTSAEVSSAPRDRWLADLADRALTRVRADLEATLTTAVKPGQNAAVVYRMLRRAAPTVAWLRTVDETAPGTLPAGLVESEVELLLRACFNFGFKETPEELGAAAALSAEIRSLTRDQLVVNELDALDAHIHEAARTEASMRTFVAADGTVRCIGCAGPAVDTRDWLAVDVTGPGQGGASYFRPRCRRCRNWAVAADCLPWWAPFIPGGIFLFAAYLSGHPFWVLLSVALVMSVLVVNLKRIDLSQKIKAKILADPFYVDLQAEGLHLAAHWNPQNTRRQQQ